MTDEPFRMTPEMLLPTEEGEAAREAEIERHAAPGEDGEYFVPEEARILCMDTDPQWKEERRHLVTASEMMCFLGLEPSWWSDSWADILALKVSGEDKVFTGDSLANVTHGRRTEVLNLELTSELLGFAVTRHNAMYVNGRWPMLSATLDGILWTQNGRRGLGPNLDLSTQHGLVAEVYEALSVLPGPVMVESKNARHPDPFGSKVKKGQKVSWFSDYPDYHIPQIQTGMHIADFEWCVLCARLGGRDMAPHLIKRDPEWADRLDTANEIAVVALKVVR